MYGFLNVMNSKYIVAKYRGKCYAFHGILFFYVSRRGVAIGGMEQK